jgi:hypothetical protein
LLLCLQLLATLAGQQDRPIHFDSEGPVHLLFRGFRRLGFTSMPFLHGSTEMLAHACNARNLGSSFRVKKLPKCFICEGRGLGCGFIGASRLPEFPELNSGLTGMQEIGPLPTAIL